MDFSPQDSRESLHSRRYVDPNPPVNHTRRTWTNNNGVHYTVETTSYSSPGLVFEMSGGTSSGVLSRSHSNARSQGSGLLGTAFGLLGDVMAPKTQSSLHGDSRRSARRAYNEDLAYGDTNMEAQRNHRPRSFISGLADRLLNSQQRRSRRTPYSRDHSPARREPYRARERRRPHPSGDRKSTWSSGRAVYVDETTDEESESEDEDLPPQQKPRRAFTAKDASLIEALENAATHHRREARECRARLESASRQPMVGASALQNLLNELKGHEDAYENALENLQMAKEGRSTGASRHSAPRRTRPSRTPRGQPSPEDDFDAFSQSNRSRDPFFDEDPDFNHHFDPFARTGFGDFHSFFNGFGTRSPFEDAFFNMPGATFTFSAGQNRRPRAARNNSGGQYHQRMPEYANFAAPPQRPPATLLKPDEARGLFKTYNDRWNSMAATDPNIPYPARGLGSAALLARDSLWAPNVNSPVASWSNETVMQANAQAFFLGAVGLSPQYSQAPATGRVTMGYEKTQANPTQVKELMEILKKEKTRWHSDRLGRRNGGFGAGQNEALQCDEKARAVFHAVCELIEVVQGP